MYSTLSSHGSVDDTAKDAQANELSEDTLTKPSGQFSRATFSSIRFVERLASKVKRLAKYDSAG